MVGMDVDVGRFLPTNMPTGPLNPHLKPLSSDIFVSVARDQGANESVKFVLARIQDLGQFASVLQDIASSWVMDYGITVGSQCALLWLNYMIW